MNQPHYQVVVIGAGAAGLLAATRAAQRGRRTLLVEKNRRPGVKILMSGGTRCNLTHAADARGIVEAFGAQGPFLHSALAALSPDELVAMFEAEGVATKIEPGGKIFPVSDRATDVLAALERMLLRSGVPLWTEAAVRSVRAATTGRGFVVDVGGETVAAEAVIIAVGGQSYSGCGTSGDGYAWAKSLGHAIVPPRPALTPLTSPAAWVKELRGVTIADAAITVVQPRALPGGKSESPARSAASKNSRAELGAECAVLRRGGLLFTHFGLSGPAPMDVSRAVSERPSAGWMCVCDFAPDRRENELLDQWSREAARGGKRGVLGVVSELAPRRLAEALFAQAGVPLERRFAELSKGEKTALVAAIKRTAVPIDGTLGFKKAEVTAGGVSLAEVDSRTLQSKLVRGLYFAGEILDLDGPIGGYNFQAAFSTGWLAGSHA